MNAKMTGFTGALLLGAFAAHAGDEFRCGNSIINSDMTPAEILQKCGEPTSKKESEEDVRAANVGGGTRKVGVAHTETWTYDRGYGAFALVVTIVDGKVRGIHTQP